MSADPVRVLVVDDQAPFRLAARAVFGRADGFEVAAEADSGEAALDRADEVGPDLVLMDINMGAMDGVEATQRLVAAHPSTVVFLCSTYAEADLPAGSMDGGAAAYINKEELTPDLIASLWADHASA